MVCNKNFNRAEAILYPSALCNLKCRYCSISKNSSLKEIDELLEKSFEDDYYFNRIREYFPERFQLKTLSFWGAEPFLKIERVFATLHKLINYYPYLKNFFNSTNFSFNGWVDKAFELLQQFKRYPYRTFDYTLQLSCDGPTEINDAGRGRGTTKKCLENYKIFISSLYNQLPANVNLNITIKPTLDIKTLYSLSSKEAIVNYYSFFEENFILPIQQLNYANVKIFCPIPNVAVPVPATQADGKQFAYFCKLCGEIEKNAARYFQIYQSITPYRRENIEVKASCECCGDYCGSGNYMIGFLPNNLIGTCDMSFTQICDNYKELAKQDTSALQNSTIDLTKMYQTFDNRLVLNDEDYKIYEAHMRHYTNYSSTASVAVIANQILLMAMCGQIEKIYISQAEAIKAAQFIRRACYCVKDNFEVNNSSLLVPTGIIKLLLNGALPLILGDKYEQRAF